jgi:hypothetical protein
MQIQLAHSPLRNFIIIWLTLFIVVVLSPFDSASQIKLAWDPETDPSVTGYAVYYGTASRNYGIPIYVGNVTTYTLNGLTQGVTYYIAVTAYDTANYESGYSNEVSGKITETVSTPNVLSGPVSGITGGPCSYTTGGSTSSLGNPVQYQFDWKGDGTDLSTRGSATQAKTWTVAGTYNVRARAGSTLNASVVSNWFGSLSVTITAPETVSPPSPPTGSSSGTVGTVYSYSTGGSTSSLGHSVQYLFNWGDGTSSGWLSVGQTSASKSWSSGGTYSVTAQARCSTDTSVVSGPSSTLTVTITASTVSCTLTTNPSGLQITVDGSTYTAPQSFSWVAGSSHTISVPSPQSGAFGVRYVYASWSDGGSQSHTVTVPSSGITYTANLTTQYSMTTSVNPAGAGTVSPSGTSWYRSGQSASVSATANSGWAFRSWSGDLSGLTNRSLVVMNGPKNVTANFTQKVHVKKR